MVRASGAQSREKSPNYQSSWLNTAGVWEKQANKLTNFVFDCTLLATTSGETSDLQRNLLLQNLLYPRLAATTFPLPPLSSFAISYQNKLGCSRRAFPLSSCCTAQGWEGWRLLFWRPLVFTELWLSQALGPANASQGLPRSPPANLTKENGKQAVF